MKRFAEMERLNYETAIKKAQLVERNPLKLLDASRVSMHDENDIISLATQIQEADQHLKSSACGKLSLILDQIRMLQSQAVEILRETEQSRKLHNAACNFTKKPGSIYHLYQRTSGQNYFSMLSPEEWNDSVNQQYLGSYRLEHDFSWTPVNELETRDKKISWAEQCLSTSVKHEKIDFGLSSLVQEGNNTLQSVE